MTAKKKGDLLEDLVALMHDTPGVDVKKRVKLPVLHSKSRRKREVDVLLTTNAAGYQVRLAIGCKNEKSKLDVNDVDNFSNILRDVGIPLQHGILVSVSGYTRDALDSAGQKGMRTLIFEGLTPDRMSIEVNAALRSVLYLFISSSNLTASTFPFLPKSARETQWPTDTIDSKDPPSTAQLLSCLWRMWICGKVPNRIGEHVAAIIPISCDAHWMAILDLKVEGRVASLHGTYSRRVLKDAQAANIERVQVAADFSPPQKVQNLSHIESEDELSALVDQDKLHILTRVRVPRLLTSLGFWPQSVEEAERAKALIERGEPVTFDALGVTNLADAWRFR